MATSSWKDFTMASFLPAPRSAAPWSKLRPMTRNYYAISKLPHPMAAVRNFSK